MYFGSAQHEDILNAVGDASNIYNSNIGNFTPNLKKLFTEIDWEYEDKWKRTYNNNLLKPNDNKRQKRKTKRIRKKNN